MSDAKSLEDAAGESFDNMMDALDVFFHVAVCPNHTEQDRQEAFGQARQCFIDFAYDGEDPENQTPAPRAARPATVASDAKEQNAPTSAKVH